RLAFDRDDPRPLLAGALGHELLDPVPERSKAGRREKGQLVAAGAGGGAEERAETQRSVLGGSVGQRFVSRGRGALRERGEIETEERRRDGPEVGQRGESAADVGRVSEDPTKAIPGRQGIEGRAGVGDGRK